MNDKWNEVGLALNVPLNVLNGLDKSRKSNIVKLSEVIQCWKTAQPSPVTWKTVINALEGPIVNNKAKASQIRDYLGLTI